MKRILSFLLSLAMIISMVPAGAFATELETAPVAETQAVTEAPTEQETEAPETEAAEAPAAETEPAELPEETMPAETEEVIPETTEVSVEETVAEAAVATAEDDFRAAIAAAEESGENLPIWDEITLTRDLTVNMTGELSFADFSKLVVPSGVTLTLNCPTVINGATLIVEEGGTLVSNVNLSIVAPMNPATFEMNGAFVNNGQVWVNEGGTVNMGGTADSAGPIFVGFGGNGQTSTLNINGTLSTSGYLCISNSGAPGLLRLGSGATLHILNNENGCGYLDNTSRVELNGTLNLDGNFTTGALQENGNVVGSDASAEIRGTVIAGEKSSIGVLPKGSVNFFGTLTTDGEVKVEPNGALWVDNTVTMNGPVTVAGYLHVDFIDDVAGVGVLNLNGTTDVTGYLAVHDGGTLNTGASSVLNIQNIENVGCGYLDNQGTVNLNGKMNLDGLFTTGAAQDDAGNVVGPDATAVNNGTIEASATSLLGVGPGGTMTNNGTVTTAGECNVGGTWLGNPVQVKENTMSFEEFKAMLATGDAWLNAKVIIEEDLVVDTRLDIYSDGEIVVPSGVTLTLEQRQETWISGGKLIVEQGGSLVNNASIMVEGGGTLDVRGSFSMGTSGLISLIWYRGEVINGVDHSLIHAQGNVYTEEELRAMLGQTDYKTVIVSLHESVRLSSDLYIAENMRLMMDGDPELGEGPELIVPSGVTLTVDGNLNMFGAGITVEPGGTLRINESAWVQMYYGYIHAEGATVETAVGRIHMHFDGYSEILGVDTSLVNGTCKVKNMDDLRKAVGLCSLYNFVEIEPYTTITVEENLTIPGNSMFAMYDQGELMQLIIPDGVTVFNCTTIVVNNNCQVWIQTGGTLDNSQGGSVNDYTGTGLIVDGTLIADTTGGGGGGGGYSGVTSFEELKAAAEAGEEWIEIYDSITLTENLTIPSACYVDIYEDGEIIVPDGMTLTMLGGMSIYTGKLTVLAGGTAEVASLYVNGTVTVDPNGSFTVLQDRGMMVRYGCQITGIPKSSYGVEYMAYSEADIRTGLKIAGHNWVSVRLYEDVTLKSNLTIPQYTSLIIESLWQDGEDVPVTLSVPSGKTITNNGTLATTEPEGCLVIEKGGKVINNAAIYNHAFLENRGEIVNNGEMYLYGTMTGDGKITGDGHVDFARPVYSHADLVNWLSSNLVPTYLYVWGEVTLEDDVTIPAGTQLIMEGSTLIVPDGVTVTMDGKLYAQLGGNVTFASGSELICNNWAAAYSGSTITFEAGSKLVNNDQVSAVKGGTLNIFGTYVRGNEDANLVLYEGGTINGTDSGNIHYSAGFADEASLAAILNTVKAEGYGQVTAYQKSGCGDVDITGKITVPAGGYLVLDEGSLMLKPGAVLTNYGEIIIYAPAKLIVEAGAEFINHGTIDAEEGSIIYQGGGITLSADALQILGKGKVNITAALTPASSAKITWTLAEGDELYAALKASGSKAVLTAADVTGKRTVKVTASATLENGAEVSDTIEIAIIPLTKQITLLSGGKDVTGQTLIYDLANENNGSNLDLAAVIGPDDAAATLEWTSSAEAIATVAGGKVSFTGKPGKVTVTASATDGSRVSAKVTIEAVKLVQFLTLLSGDSRLVGGKSTQLKVQDAQNPGTALAAGAATWTLANAADASYVTVTPAGKVTTKAVPQRISVKLLCSIADNPDAKTLEHTITVYPAVTQVDLADGDEVYTGKTLKFGRGETITLRAKQYPADSMEGITWNISDEDGKLVEILSRTEDALILKSTGTKGTVTVKITANDGSRKSATVKLQTGIYVEEVAVSSPAADLVSGESLQLSAAVKPADADNTAVVWALADPADKQFVSVSSSGKVTAKKGLSMSKAVTVVATAKDGCGAFGSVTLQLQPADPGALVILAENGSNVTGTTVNVDLLAGGAVKLKAKYFDADSADVTWSGKNVTFSEADAVGYVTATVSGKGTFTVTADDGNGKKATLKLKAANLSEQVVISGPTEVASGKSIQLTAAVLPAGQVAEKKVNWWVDPAYADCAKISSSGKLTAAKNLMEVRSIIVWAQSKDGNSEPAAFRVDILPLAQSVQILESGIDVTNTTYIWDLAVDEGKPAITAEVFAADASQAVVWKLSGAKVLQRNADGTFSVTGKTGTATVTATASDGSGKKASFKFTVVKSMEYIAQSRTEAVIAGGKSLKLAAFLTVDKTATNQKLTWSMAGDTEVATLNATGVLKTKKVTDVHTITVTATAADGSGCHAEFTVLVYPATTSVKLLCDGETAPKQAALGIGQTLTLEGISLPSAAAQGPGAYTWKLSSDKFAALKENADGTVTVTGLSAGTVTVTCTAADGTGKKATLKIKVG